MTETLIGASRALLEALLLNSLYAAALAVVAWAVLRITRVRAAVVVETMWWLVVLRLVLPPSLHSTVSLRALSDRVLGLFPSAAAPVQPVTLPEAVVAETGLLRANATSAVALWPLVLAVLWLVGVVVVTVWSLRVLLRFRRIAAGASAVDDPRVLVLLAEWQVRLGIGRPVRIVASDACLTPFASGVRRPAVFLPTALLDWPASRLEPVIAHELTHVGRLDEVRIVLANAFVALHFFNPLVWFAARALARARERACDERVVGSREIAPSEYGASLVDVLRLHVLGPLSSEVALGLIDGREGMHMRLESILNGRPFSRLQTKVVLAGVVCAALAILPLARAERQAGSELDDPPATPTPRQVSQEEFEKRVQEEVTRRLADEEARLRTELELQRAKAGASSAELQRQLAERVASERARQSGEPLRIAGAIVPPSKLTDRRPVYPDEARKARVQGVVILELVVERDGSVSSARPLRSLPMGLTEAAIEAARSWRYQPATLDGQPVSVFLAAAVVFSIGGTPSADEAAALSAVRPDEDAAAGLPTPELREQARQQSVDALKRMGGPNAELLSELAEMLPKGSVLSKLSIGPDRSLRLSGTAANEADVAELMSTMQRSSRFASAELASVTRREQGSVEFEIRCPLVEDLQ